MHVIQLGREVVVMGLVLAMVGVGTSCGPVSGASSGEATQGISNSAKPSDDPSTGAVHAKNQSSIGSESQTEPHWMRWVTQSDSPPEPDPELPEDLKDVRDRVRPGMRKWEADRVLAPLARGTSSYSHSSVSGPTLRFEYTDNWHATVTMANDSGDDSIVGEIAFERATFPRMPGHVFRGISPRQRKIRAVLADADFQRPSSKDSASAYIRAVNLLVSLGEEEATRELWAYVRVVYGGDAEERIEPEEYVGTSHGIMRVMALLFPEAAPDLNASHHRDLGQGQARLSPHKGDWHQWPCFPMTTECDVPFDVAMGYRLSGVPSTPHHVLRTYSRTGVFRTEPLTPRADPLSAAIRLAVSDRFLELRGRG